MTACTHPRSIWSHGCNQCPDCGHKWGGPNEARLRAEGYVQKAPGVWGRPTKPRTRMEVGRSFLLTIVRCSGSTETDDEILARFKDRLHPDGYYVLEGP